MPRLYAMILVDPLASWWKHPAMIFTNAGKSDGRPDHETNRRLRGTVTRAESGSCPSSRETLDRAWTWTMTDSLVYAVMFVSPPDSRRKQIPETLCPKAQGGLEAALGDFSFLSG